MIDDEQQQMFVYSHAVQLTQINHSVSGALLIARHLVARAFDVADHRAGMNEARQALPFAASENGPAGTPSKTAAPLHASGPSGQTSTVAGNLRPK